MPPAHLVTTSGVRVIQTGPAVTERPLVIKSLPATAPRPPVAETKVGRPQPTTMTLLSS